MISFNSFENSMRKRLLGLLETIYLIIKEIVVKRIVTKVKYSEP